MFLAFVIILATMSNSSIVLQLSEKSANFKNSKTKLYCKIHKGQDLYNGDFKNDNLCLDRPEFLTIHPYDIMLT